MFQAKNSIKHEGGKVHSSLTKDTDFLVVGESPGSKLKKAHELGIKEVPIKIVMSEIPTDLMAAAEDYIPTEVEGYPPRAREYARRKNEV